MGDSTGTNRRTVLRTLGSLGLASPFVSSAGARERADSDCPDWSGRVGRPDRSDSADRPERPGRSAVEGRPERSPRQSHEVRARALANRPGRYVAVVDRIVDGRHAVLLLEDGDDVVDQLVVSPDELPTVEGGDVLLVTLVDDGEELESVRRLDGETERRRRANRERFDSLAEDCC
ncbi:DUF3006 family protein [Halomontanus rarus]|uniref:DUF3006 family protein n=1 Tax=Halomontanus rarus TaxID=3034020 RepID=UPI0023E81BCD|nr:DUF3006 family protein [Halovivax sp. TS33]